MTFTQAALTTYIYRCDRNYEGCHIKKECCSTGEQQKKERERGKRYSTYSR